MKLQWDEPISAADRLALYAHGIATSDVGVLLGCVFDLPEDEAESLRLRYRAEYVLGTERRLDGRQADVGGAAG